MMFLMNYFVKKSGIYVGKYLQIHKYYLHTHSSIFAASKNTRLVLKLLQTIIKGRPFMSHKVYVAQTSEN